MGMVCHLHQLEPVTIDAIRSDPSQWQNLLNHPQDKIDIDKAWHGLHYLLTGTASNGEEPLCFLLRGGDALETGREPGNPVRLLHPHQVAWFSEALCETTHQQLCERFDPRRMIENNIYPNIWEHDPKEQNTLGYLLEYFEILKRFFNSAQEQNRGVMIYLTG